MEMTQILFEEHRNIYRVLDCLEKAVNLLENAYTVQPGFFIEVVHFNKNFVVNHHQKIEETIFFETMFKCGLSRNNRTLLIASLEHEQIVLYTRRLVTAAKRWQSGIQSAYREMIRNVWGFISLMQRHMQDEENLIFAMAKNFIPENMENDMIHQYGKFMQKGYEQAIYTNSADIISSYEQILAKL